MQVRQQLQEQNERLQHHLHPESSWYWVRRNSFPKQP
jgi:hypothetical protein